jgi:hypothetical protein
LHCIEFPARSLCGSSVALAIAEDALAIHAGGRPRGQDDLPGAVLDRLRDVGFHVMPRMSPDGAEAVLTSGRYVRSVPRDARPNKLHPRWVNEDIDGDGVALLMRVVDPRGEYVELPGRLRPSPIRSRRCWMSYVRVACQSQRRYARGCCSRWT